MPATPTMLGTGKALKLALTYWNRVEPRPRAAEIASTLAARVRDATWMLTRQWQFGEFHGEDAGSPAFVQLATTVSPVLGWRPAGSGTALAPIDAPLEELVATEGFTPDLATRVELGQIFEQLLGEQALSQATLDAILDTLRGLPDFRVDGTGIAAQDASASRLLAVCEGRALDGAALARAAGAALPAVDVLTANTVAIQAALAALAEDIRATLGSVATSDAPCWSSEALEYRPEVVTALPGGGAALLAAHPDRDATFDWYSFDFQEEVKLPQGAAVPVSSSVSRLPTHVRFRGMPNSRWWDFERGVTDFGAVTPDQRDLAKLIVMDFMLIASNDYFVVPFDVPVGSACAIDRFLVHDVFGGITLVDRADTGDSGLAARWTCFSVARADGGAPAGIFFLPPSAGSGSILGEALEEVRFIRDEQANLAWAIEFSAEGGDGRLQLGHERSVAESAVEPAPALLQTSDAALRYDLQTFVPRHWFPLLPVVVDATRGETAFELGRMIRPDGAIPEPRGRVLQPAASPYRIREEEIPRVGTRVLRVPVRARGMLGATHLWLARRRLVGRGEGSSGLQYDRANLVTPPPEP